MFKPESTNLLNRSPTKGKYSFISIKVDDIHQFYSVVQKRNTVCTEWVMLILAYIR